MIASSPNGQKLQRRFENAVMHADIELRPGYLVEPKGASGRDCAGKREGKPASRAFLLFVPPAKQKHRIGRMESKNFEPFVGRLIAARQHKESHSIEWLDQLLAREEDSNPQVGYSPTLDFESKVHSTTLPPLQQKTRIIWGCWRFCKTKNAGFSYGRSDLAGKPARTLGRRRGGRWRVNADPSGEAAKYGFVVLLARTN